MDYEKAIAEIWVAVNAGLEAISRYPEHPMTASEILLKRAQKTLSNMIKTKTFPYYTGVFWVLKGGLDDKEVRVNGKVRTDYVKIFNQDGGIGFVLAGLTWDEYCNVQVVEVPKPLSAKEKG